MGYCYFNFLGDLTGALVFCFSSYFFQTPDSFSLVPTYETINNIKIGVDMNKGN